MSRPKHRDIACARCFRLKRKCDHGKPTCGECRRKGAECLPAKSRRTGDTITIPVEYLRQLEERVAELDRRSSVVAADVETCDAGVQTDSTTDVEPSRCNTPSASLLMPWHLPETKISDWGGMQDTENDGALISLCESPSQRDRGRRTPISCSSPVDAFFLAEAAINLSSLDVGPVYSAISDDSIWITELYTNMYFSITHREWPFLNEPAWKSWHMDVILGGQDDWRVFFLRMVYAIGALLCSTIQRDSAHSARSRELYASAMRYYPHVVGQSSMVLQIQASLLMILYALHSPSSEEMSTTVSSVVPFCTAAMAEIRKHASACRDSNTMTESDEVLTENMFITCYMLNEIVVSGWDRPVSPAYKAVDDDMCILGDAIQPPIWTNPALSHLFRLRRIQANIRRSRENKLRRRFEYTPGSSSSLKSALDIWRQDIPLYVTENAPCGYLHPIWMTKLYNYSILILMEEKRSILEHDAAEDILSAVVEVCLNFRLLQEEGHVMCYTWSALVFQFRAGIMLLYIVWATTPVGSNEETQQQDIVNQSPEAIGICATNLAGFADRWTDAMPYLKLFGFLRHKILGSPDPSSLDTNDSVSLDEAKSFLGLLKKKYLHRAVLGMIEDMMFGGLVQWGICDVLTNIG